MIGRRAVGRWLGSLAKGHYQHENIAKSPTMAGQGAIGWAAHYVIGCVFAALLLVMAGTEWARQPSLAIAMVFGAATVIMPYFVLQPAFGTSIAASKTA